MATNWTPGGSPAAERKLWPHMIVKAMGRRISGSIELPGSKSFTNRALIIAACAQGTSYLSGVLRSDDSYWCMESLRQLGVGIEDEGDRVRITGPSEWASHGEPLYVGSGGTTGRFLTSVVALSTRSAVTITASEQLSGRPMRALFDALATLGARIHYLGEPGCFPVRIEPCGAGESVVSVSGSQSSQFLSGLLMATPLMRRPVEIRITDHIVQADYVRITLEVLAAFGVNVETSSQFDRFYVQPSVFLPAEYAVEADASTATYFLAMGALMGEVTVSNLRPGTTQPDIAFLDVMRRMGCSVEGVTVRGPEKLRGGFSIDMRAFSDSCLTLAAMAPFADAPIEITGVEHIRHHESDRIGVMARTLTDLGVPVEERADGLRISPAMPRFGRVETHDDHRVAMSMAVLGLAGSGVELSDPGCVSKTCPNFFDLIGSLGADVAVVR